MLTRISATGTQAEVDFDRTRIALTEAEVTTLTRAGATREQLDQETRTTLETKYGRALPVPIFLHKNRDGSVQAMAGARPLIMDEDLPRER